MGEGKARVKFRKFGKGGSNTAETETTNRMGR